MAVQDANIAIRVGGDVTQLKSAMAAGSASVSDFARKSATQLRETANQLAKVGAAAAAAGGVALVGLARHAATTGTELTNMARVSKANVVEFQRMAAAARPLGVENEKLSDILKDVNDRIGDFLQTGGGPMADFFENIAPKVGVTAQQFAKLSGPQALQLFYTSLEKANLSQADMTFYLEAMAGDLTKLQPLLRNNGAEIARVAARAEELGLILSEIEVAKLAEGDKAFREMGDSIKMIGTLIGLEVLPYIQELINRLMGAAQEAGGFRNAIKVSAETAITGFAKAADVLHGLRVVFKGLELLATAFGAAVVSAVELSATVVSKFVDMQIRGVNAVIQALNKLPKVDIATVDPFSQSAFMQGLHNMGDSARDEVGRLRAELHELAMQELPSDKVEAFLNAVAVKSEETAARVAAANPMSALQLPTNAANDDGGGSGGLDKKTQEQLEALRGKYVSEQEVMRQHQETMALIGEEYDARKFESEQQWRDVRLQAEADFYSKIRGLADQGYQGVQSVMAQRWGAIGAETSGALKSIVGTMATSSRKAFEISKAWALADALISTAQGIAAGVRLGWPMGVPAVAWAAANGFAQVNAIKNQKFGGAGGAAASGGGTPGTAPNPVGVGGSTGGGGSSGSDQGALVTFSGIEAGKMYDGRHMISVIQEAINNGARLRIDGAA